MSWLSRRVTSVLVPLALLGCSIAAKTDAPQCANDNDCFVKFGGGYACVSGGCVRSSSAQSVTPVVTTLKECRATQECVATLGEGFLCRRDRNDPQKKGVCQQLTPSSDCSVLGEYKDDQVILFGALLPGKASPSLATAVRSGLERAVEDWSKVGRQLQAQTTGADTVAPPRPFAVIACSEDVAEADLRNIYLNSGTRLILGPSAMTAAMQELTRELTNAKITFISPTSFSAPTDGANIGSFYFRPAGTQASIAAALSALKPPPAALWRPTASYKDINDLLTFSPAPPVSTYDDPASFVPPSVANVLVLGDGEAATLLARVSATGTAYLLPSAIPDAARLRASLPATTSVKAVRSTTVPVPAFAPAGFGDAEMYDATFLALAALAAVDAGVSAEDAKDEVIQAAVLRASAPTGKEIAAQGSSVRDILTSLRASADATIHLMGATGSLALTGGSGTHALTACAVSETGCN